VVRAEGQHASARTAERNLPLVGRAARRSSVAAGMRSVGCVVLLIAVREYGPSWRRQGWPVHREPAARREHRDAEALEFFGEPTTPTHAPARAQMRSPNKHGQWVEAERTARRFGRRDDRGFRAAEGLGSADAIGRYLATLTVQ
jgi:hypothetical protein